MKTSAFLRPLIFIILLILFSFPFGISAQNLIINEFMASNITSTPEIVDYDDYSDWIEIYNREEESVNIGGYGISDNLEDPAKWKFPSGTVIPAKGYLLLWADGYNDYPRPGIKYFHLNFKLSQEGEEIGLFTPSGQLIDSVIFGPQISDVSYGRTFNGEIDWYFFGEPTPGAANTTEGVLDKIWTNVPEITLESGFYEGIQMIEASAISGNSLIAYTKDGSRPSSKSSIYSNPIEISENTVVRFRAFEEGKLPSKIVTRTYFIDQEQRLPVISLTVQPETFFDAEIGIYDNQIKTMEVPVNVQYFEKNGGLAYEVDAGVRLTGQASYQYPQKPLTIELDDKYGYEAINYPVFSSRQFKRFKSLYLRNSGTQDHRHTLFRDALQHTIVINQMDVDCQAYQPAAAFINGEYWGVYNLREKLDNEYLVNHHNINPDNLDYLEYEFNAEPVVIEGSAEAYYALQNFLSSNSMNISGNWEYVKSQIDVNEVMNYLITEIYCDNYNWPNTNSRWWREKSDEGKWRYIFLDSDYGFGAPSWNSHYTNNTLEFMYSQPPFSTLVFRKLLDNNDFRNEFIQRFATHLGSTLSTERVLNIFDSLKTQIYSEMPFHIDRWNDDPSPIYGYPPIPDISAWEAEVRIMREFAEERNRYMKQHIEDFFNLSGTSNVKFIADDIGGHIKVGGIKIKNGFSADYYRYVPVKIEAVPTVGYRFVKWIGVSDSISASALFTPLRSDTTIQIKAVFELDDVSILPQVISENTILKLAGSPYYAKGDVNVNPGAKLMVDPGVKIFMPGNASLYVKGEIEINGTEELPVNIQPNETSGFLNWGIVYIDSASGPCVLNNLNIIGATQILDSDSGKIGAISSYKSDLTLDGVKIFDAPFPVFTRYGNVIVQNSEFHSEEICDLINIKYAESALVENCVFRGNNAYDTDAIDYDKISEGIIRNNKIYNFYGFNSDGIDLGEGSKDILIENNLILNCNDKGISVGQASTTLVKNNIIVNCAQGVGIKDDSSFAYIDRSTFYGCSYGVASFEKNLGAGGGNAEIVNSIFSQSILSPVFVDDLSILNVSYSLSDTEILEGTNNLRTDPRFLNDFFLDPSSPAIDSGNPASGTDPDGSLPDLGARHYTGLNHPLIINEINYDPPGGEGYEFIEIYNSSSNVIDISGYAVSGSLQYDFPAGTLIQAKEFIVMAKDASLFSNINADVMGWGSQSLPNDWGNLVLLNDSGEEIDFISYSSKFGWPAAQEGEDFSIELRDPGSENIAVQNWKISSSRGGSPGRENRIDFAGNLFINELQADNESTIKDEFDGYDDWIEVYNAGNDKINISNFFISDDFRNLTKHRFVSTNTDWDFINPGEHKILWADGDIEQGAEHLNFRLNNNGEEIVLSYIFDGDTIIVDSVSFNEQKADYSFARKDDGGNEWTEVKMPTPAQRNSYPGLFKQGILLVNGYGLDNQDVINFYNDKALWGKYKISFWDLFAMLTLTGYPESLPEPVGHGSVPLNTLTKYSTVIWTGENNPTELARWNSSPLLQYVKMGGNLFILLKNGSEYINEEMLERIGINWNDNTNYQIMSCMPVYEGLDTISIKTGQYLSAVFDTSLVSNSSKVLFADSEASNQTYGVSVWNKPDNGGWYKDNGGQIILLSGRGYRYESAGLMKNMEFILKNFFEEQDIITDTFDYGDHVITEYKLDQNYPNPFNPLTVIKYDLLKSSDVELKIYDVLGREVITLVNEYQERGRRTAIWNGVDKFNSKVSSGIYFYRISAGKWTDVKKMMLVK